ncbi:unnamed protein product [Miscanthus lutarioriparius]|uniref:Uncharacterized protein n=1 Tax=Miscanthus lutarioriparius TaxID=422564 RepID=A0A811QBF5_9POAL|nr:unnamed protein product [Miscanthus lutarioriparius]
MGDTDETVAYEINQTQETETGVSATGVVDVDKEQQQTKDGEKVDEESKKRKPMALRSDVSDSFSKAKLDNGEERAKCKWCTKLFHCGSRTNAHFIDNDWNLQKKIIGFFLVKGHRGEDIGRSLENCLAEWGIDKVFTITVDNSSANNNAIKYMRRVLNESKGCFVEGEYLHMRCAAHIINLIVGDGLKEIDKSIQHVHALC